MGNLANIQPVWEPNIFQIETNDPVIGGTPNAGTGAGTNNIAAYQLANRTEFLKSAVDGLSAQLAGGDPFPTYLTSARGDARYYTQAQVDALVASALPAGVELLWSGSTPPDGWLEEDGAAISRTTYADLFARLGSLYGAGDGATTFNLPDARAEFIRGWDNGRGVDAGRSLGSFQAELIGAHSHFLRGWSGTGGADNNISLDNHDAQSVDGSETEITGGAENRPRNTARMIIIKY